MGQNPQNNGTMKEFPVRRNQVRCSGQERLAMEPSCEGQGWPGQNIQSQPGALWEPRNWKQGNVSMHLDPGPGIEEVPGRPMVLDGSGHMLRLLWRPNGASALGIVKLCPSP